MSYALHAVVGAEGTVLDVLFDDWLWNGLFFLAAGICVARALLVRAERVAWLMVGIGLAVFGGGWVYYTAVVQEMASPPFPSPADGMWFVFYPLVYAACVLLLRERMRVLAREVWLDGLIGALAVGALAAAFVFGPLLEATGASVPAVVTNMTYALLDIHMFGFLLGVMVLTQWRPGRAWQAMAAGFAAAIAGDAVFAYEVPVGTFELGGLMDATWPAMALALGYAAWQPAARMEPAKLGGSTMLAVPAAFALVAIALHVYASFANVSDAATLLASATLVAAAARTYGAYKEMRRLETAVGRDALTGLLNHREFHTTVERELRRAERNGGRFSVLALDLDGFKRLNDSYGHAEGDEVLRRVADAMRSVCRDSDAACRIGGDEFGIVLPRADAAAAQTVGERISASVRALDAHVGVSFGVAEWPTDGPTKDLLLLHADTGLYAAKPRSDRQRLEATAGITTPRAADDLPAAGTAADDGSAGDVVSRFLAVLREQLQMELTFVGEFTDGREVFRSVDGDADSFGLTEGSSIALDASYCHRVVEGAIPNVIRDAKRDPHVKELDATEEADIGSYIGVPLLLSSGGLYGMLCGISHSPDPSLGERDLSFMRVIGRLIVDQLEHDELESENRRLQSELAGIEALIAALDARDEYTCNHSKEVVELSAHIAETIGLGKGQLAEVRQVALLHDLGKIGIPDAVLRKPGRLSPEEWECMQQHPVIGERIVASIGSLAHLAPAVRAEHERWDGGGYPDGLSGDDIPLASRIVFAADAYHAMTSDRPYRAAMTKTDALEELEKNAGSQFDPVVVRHLIAQLTDDRSEVPLTSSWSTTEGVQSGVRSPATASRPPFA